MRSTRPGETVLDLCAAPGGKATQMGAAMRGEGLLICNEPVPGRAQILSRNLERMGITNAVAVCAMPDVLAERWPEGFDAVLADAPCSGEGMFRRVPESRGEWTESAPEGCAARQAAILDAAARMVRPGGRLVYATCTSNRT
ncbi:MAG: RsmB/NOP family class I SAM-dependent RNA methyltransferase, partial [Clostridia bacterium]|nr:RsmB/NOP family class I SAM-dependent RNA methyltransferase [Clostridia bacterium]